MLRELEVRNLEKQKDFVKFIFISKSHKRNIEQSNNA